MLQFFFSFAYCSVVWKVWAFFWCILQLYCPTGISPMGNSGCFPGERQLRQSHATQLTVHTGCFNVSIIHRTLTWTTGSLTCAQMLMHVVAHVGVYGHHKRLSTESWLLEENPLPHREIELASAAYRSDTVPTELQAHIYDVNLGLFRPRNSPGLRTVRVHASHFVLI